MFVLAMRYGTPLFSWREPSPPETNLDKKGFSNEPPWCESTDSGYRRWSHLLKAEKETTPRR